MLRRIFRSLPLLLGTFVVTCGATGAQLVLVDPPLRWPSDWAWFTSIPNLSCLATAFLAGLSAWASIAQLFGSQPASARNVEMDGLKTRERLGDISRHIENEGARTAKWFATTSQSIAELRHQVEAMARGLAATREGSTEQVERYRETLIDFAESGDDAQVAIVKEAIAGNPVAAADRLMEAAEADKTKSALHAAKAARIYAPFAPEKAIAAYRTGLALQPDDAVLAIELARLLRDLGRIEQSDVALNQAMSAAGSHRAKMAVNAELSLNRQIRFDFDAAMRFVELALAEADSWIEADKFSAQAWRARAGLYIQQSALLRSMGFHERAQNLEASAHEMLRFIVAERPELGGTFAQVAIEGHIASGDFAGLRRRLGQISGDRLQLRNLVITLIELASVQNDNKEVSRELLTIADSAFASLVAVHPPSRELDAIRMMLLSRWGFLRSAWGEIESSEQLMNEALSIARRWAEAPGASDFDRHSCAVGFWNLGRVQFDNGNRASAVENYAQARLELCQLSKRHSKNPRFLLDLLHVSRDAVKTSHGAAAWYGRWFLVVHVLPKLFLYLIRERNERNRQDFQERLSSIAAVRQDEVRTNTS